MMTPHVPVSWGELLDKITILQIKESKINNPQALANVKNELTLLTSTASNVADQVLPLVEQLSIVNRNLWEVEDQLRSLEALESFGETFVQLARSVYKLNDQRAAIKKQINTQLGSKLVEEKSYNENICLR
jgi:chromosome segregation ATPase